MTTYPLATLAPTISATGISAPPYSDILASMIASVQAIYGSDDILTDPSTQDSQFIAILALAQQQTNDAVTAAYESFSPVTAQGIGLSSNVKINGLRRLVPSNSQVVLTLTGVAGTAIAISNGAVLVGDNQGLGTQWLVPAVIIPLSGTVEVTATCTTQGAVAAAPETLVKILTPIPNWQTVTNAAAAITGQPIETDYALRQRQAISTALPAVTPLDSIVAAIANLSGVGRIIGYQNDTNTTNADGIPAKDICIVVEGGSISSIAQTIALTKNPGTGTYGTTSQIILDQYGVPNTINWFELANIEVYAIITLNPLTAYISTTGITLVAAVVEFLSGLAIGVDSYLNKLWSPANLSGDAATLSSGQTQVALDLLSGTYNLTSIVQARADMIVAGGPYSAGATVIALGRILEIFVGVTVAVTMDNTTTFTAVVLSIDSGTMQITLSTGIPIGRTVQNGALVYVAADLNVSFNEATLCQISNIQLNTL
jgi:uncharacterized phage protein gp47/JayE